MAKLSPLRASASRRVAGYSAGVIQSPCSRHTMCILVSAKLQATAAPEAPAPTIRTSTLSGIFALRCLAPEWSLDLEGVQQGPVGLLLVRGVRERWSRRQRKRHQYAVIAVVGI